LDDGDAVQLGHHDVQEDEIRLELAHLGQRILSVDRSDQLIALRIEPHPEHFQVCGIVIDNQNSGRRSQPALPLQAYFRNSRIFARMRRGLNGLATYPSQPAARAFASSPERAYEV